MCIVTARLPVRGEYGLEIFGNDPAKDGDTYTHICQYLIHFESLENQSKAFYRIRANPEPSTMESQWQSTSKRVSNTLISLRRMGTFSGGTSLLFSFWPPLCIVEVGRKTLRN